MSASNYFHVEVRKIKRITDSAMQLECEDDSIGTIWVPLITVADAYQYEEGDESVTVSIQEWIAKQKGFDTGN
jgi:hypothetical protein